MRCDAMRCSESWATCLALRSPSLSRSLTRIDRPTDRPTDPPLFVVSPSSSSSCVCSEHQGGHAIQAGPRAVDAGAGSKVSQRAGEGDAHSGHAREQRECFCCVGFSHFVIVFFDRAMLLSTHRAHDVQERSRLNTAGEFVITSERTRTQAENFQDCVEKLYGERQRGREGETRQGEKGKSNRASLGCVASVDHAGAVLLSVLTCCCCPFCLFVSVSVCLSVQP